jgi:hypothetical protein
MAKVRDNPITEGLSGKLGKRLFFRRLRNGTTLICMVPDFSNRVFSEEQLAHQSRFQRAAAYARVAAKTHPIYAELAKQTLKPAYNIALSDWFHPPVIHEVQRQSGRIRVNATDNVQVAKVLITILNEQGQTLEQGEAAQVNNAWWEFETSTEGKIIVETFDLAGNRTKHETTVLGVSLSEAFR